MNKIYRIVFNQATQTWTAVAENARAKGKSGRTTIGSSKLSKLMGASAISAAALLSAQVMAEDTYFHVNTGNANQAAGNATTNEGAVDAKGGALAVNSIAVGMNTTNSANSQGAIAIGQNAKNIGQASRAVTIGVNATSESANSAIVIGTNAKATLHTLPDPTKTTLRVGGWQVVVGHNAEANYDSVAIGAEAKAATDPANANANNVLGWSTAVGRNAQATAHASTAYGANTIANKQGATALGGGSKAENIYSTAVGDGAKASGLFSTSLGRSANASGALSSAIGSYSTATATNSTALGTGARSTGAASLAVGSAAQAQAFQSAAFGNGASVYAGGTQALALGANATTNDANAVALGSGARTAAAVGTTEATINGVTYGGFAGTEPIATVSVGNDTQKRTITNVAAGRITADSTDVINGSQLYAVADKLTADIKAADTNTITTVTAGKNITVKNIGTAEAPNYQVATADEVTFDSISITNGPTINNNGINMNGNRITNVAPGVDATDAVNVSQLNNATNSIYNRIDDLDKDYRAGVAGNAAMMNIPQVTRPGANLLGIGLGHHKGESAVAVGFSSSSDNEQLIFKMSGSANTQGDFTIGSGLGWQW